MAFLTADKCLNFVNVQLCTTVTAPQPNADTGTLEGTVMKDPKFSFVATVQEREDGVPADYARYGAETRDRLAETDIMLALVLDKDDDEVSFDPYNSVGC